jgi:hypothetical protein
MPRRLFRARTACHLGLLVPSRVTISPFGRHIASRPSDLGGSDSRKRHLRCWSICGILVCTVSYGTLLAAGAESVGWQMRRSCTVHCRVVFAASDARHWLLAASRSRASASLPGPLFWSIKLFELALVFWRLHRDLPPTSRQTDPVWSGISSTAVGMFYEFFFGAPTCGPRVSSTFFLICAIGWDATTLQHGRRWVLCCPVSQHCLRNAQRCGRSTEAQSRETAL